MHKPSRPRTPRYWPRMKVRGARRRRRAAFDRMAGAFDLLGVAAHDWQIKYAAAFANFRPRIILGVDFALPRGHTHMQVVADEARFVTLGPEDLDRLGSSIMKEDHGSD